MATAAELLSGVPTVDKTLVISNDLRTIHIPSSVPNLGVEYDDDVLRLDFKIPRYVSDTDLSTFQIRINYINSNGESDVYTVRDAVVDSEFIIFSWLVGPTATRYKGNTRFNICLKKVDASGIVDKEFNTTIATLPVLEGLEVDEGVVTEYTDIITQWERELFGSVDSKIAEIEAVSVIEQAAIANKGAEVLATIPADYTTAVNMTDNADRTKADAIICSAKGETIRLKDSSDDYLRGLKIYGKTEQTSTTGKQLFNPYATQNNSFGNAVVEKNGARITVTGTYYVSWPITLKAGVKYYIDFKTVGAAANRAIRFEYPNKEITETITNPASFTPTQDTVSVYLYSGLGTSGTIVYEDVQITEGSSAVTWEPYSGGVASPSSRWSQELLNIENPKIDIMGKNLIKYPYVNMSATSNGITFVANNDGTITANGTATGTAYFTLQNVASHSTAIPIPKGRYVLSGAPVEYARVAIGLWKNKKRGGTESAYVRQPFNLVIDEDDMLFDIVCTVDKGAVLDNVVFRPQLEVGDVPTSYEPYVDKQSITPNHTLLGVPVESNGNYTDINGQQWICDEVDFNRKVYTKRVGSITFDGSADEIWYDDLILDNTVMFRIQINDSVNVGNIVGKDYLCSNLPIKNMYNSDIEGTQHTMKQFYFRMNKTSLTTTNLAGFRSYLADSPMTVQYVLSEPIETPLTQTEIDWFRFAHTNFPNTTVLNDANATMELKYNADTRLWLDNIPKVTDEQAGPLVEAWMGEHFTDAEGVVYGKSAYEIAVARGFIGSEAQWLTTLNGKDGKNGEKGEKGDAGEKGDRGSSGVYVGPGEMPEDCNVQIDPNGNPISGYDLDILELSEKDIFPEQDVAFVYAENFNLYASAFPNGTFVLTEGAEYKVLWGETVYTCTAIYIESMGATAIGNTVAIGGEDNGIPFAIGSDSNGGVTIFSFDQTTKKVRIYQDEGYKIKESYIPGSLYAQIDKRIEDYINAALGGDY